MKLDLTIPTSLNEIKLGDYQKFMKILDEKEVNEINNDMFLRQKMIQIFCKVPLLAVTKMKRNDFNSISNAILGLLTIKPEFTPTTKLNNKEYGFIPNIDRDLSLGEFVDADDYMAKWSNFHKLMAVLYRPISIKKGGKYRIEEYEGDESNSTIMKEVTMDICFGAIGFFLTLNQDLLKITPKYLQRQVRGNPQAEKVLEKNGDGINIYINSLEEVCSKLTMLLPYHWEKHYIF